VNKTVEVVLGSTSHNHLLAKYATDAVVICPMNQLFLHTYSTNKPWLKIFFYQMVDVALVVIYNRQHMLGKTLQ
jgi:hypothetical protein